MFQESPVCRAEVSERVDDGSMHHRGGQLAVTQLVQSSAGENLGISVTNNKKVRLSGDENLVNIGRDDHVIRLEVTGLSGPALYC